MGKKVTLEEIAAAVQKNGWAKVTGTYVKYDSKGKVVGGCALGQGAVNLGVTYMSLRDALAGIYVFNGDDAPVALSDWIINQNDNTKTTVGEIGRLAGRRVAAILLMEFDLVPQTYTK